MSVFEYGIGTALGLGIGQVILVVGFGQDGLSRDIVVTAMVFATIGFWRGKASVAGEGAGR